MAKKARHNAVFNAISPQTQDNSPINDIDKAKIENYDQMVSENAKLQSQIEQYVQENIELKQQISDMQKSSLVMPNDIQKDEKIKHLEEKISQLQEENDTYLLKISELSFELAKANSMKTPQPQPQRRVQQQRYTMPNMYYPKNNGYDDWN